MNSIKQIAIHLKIQNAHYELGELVADGRQIYFQYYDQFLRTNLEISPFKLPLQNGILKPDTAIFDGLFGVFSDSLPDGWGRLLLDRKLLTRDIDLTHITPLDRLAYVGKSGMGGLRYVPAIEEDWLQKEIILAEIARGVQSILSDAPSNLLNDLNHLNGGSAGARPKIMAGFHPETQQLISPSTELPLGFEHWLIKFPSIQDAPDVAQIEYAYHLMAREAGLQVSDANLFQGESGEKYFGTKRFDRIGNQCLHMHSAAGLLHDNFRISSLDYGHLMDATFQLERSYEAYYKVLQLAAFNLYTNNRDDHSKNFSFLMDSDGQWQLSPAYDLTFSQTTHGHHSTSIAGESLSPGATHLLKLATTFDLNPKKCKHLIKSVKEVASEWPYYAKLASVTASSTVQINNVIKERLKK